MSFIFEFHSSVSKNGARHIDDECKDSEGGACRIFLSGLIGACFALSMISVLLYLMIKA